MRRSQGIVTTKPVVDGLFEVESTFERAVSQPAISHLRDELAQLESRQRVKKMPDQRLARR